MRLRVVACPEEWLASRISRGGGGKKVCFVG